MSLNSSTTKGNCGCRGRVTLGGVVLPLIVLCSTHSGGITALQLVQARQGPNCLALVGAHCATSLRHYSFTFCIHITPLSALNSFVPLQDLTMHFLSHLLHAR